MVMGAHVIKTWQPVLPVTSCGKSCALPGTWEPLHEWISWSFAALSKGAHPSKDPWGNPLLKGMSELAGLPLSKGHHRGIIWSIQGDAEFYANVLKLPHWQNKSPCHECDAQRPVFQRKKCPDGKSVKILKEAEQDFAIVFNRVRGDSLHILYSRGVGSHLAGSLLHYLCYYDGTRKQRVAPTQRLNMLFSKIKEKYTRMTNLRLSMFTDPKKPHKQFPCLEAKAAKTKHILPCPP